MGCRKIIYNYNFFRIFKLFDAIFKLIIAKCMLLFMRNFRKRDVWLICEKKSEARDNGFWLFRYIRLNHPEIDVFFVIEKKSPDLFKIKDYGNIIRANSLKHYIFWLNASKSISSQIYGAIPFPERILYKCRILCRTNQKVVFLQHGIIKDYIKSLDYNRNKLDLFITSTKRERLFVQNVNHYPKKKVKELGLCRFDNLFNNGKTEKQILIMPTFRQWLTSSDITKEASEHEKEVFQKSNFFQMYKRLLTNVNLINLLKKYNYRICFYLHYGLQSFVSCFKPFENDIVVIADRKKYDVQDLLMRSSLLVTDYSSVFFDFAYMNKPEIFFQFDKLEYRKKHYAEGYFSYENDGFGPVFEQLDGVESYLIKMIKNDCQIEDIYIKRIDAFFDLRDNLNCKRNFEAIQELE